MVPVISHIACKSALRNGLTAFSGKTFPRGNYSYPLALLSGRYFGGNVGGMDAAIEPPRMGSRRFPEKHLAESKARGEQILPELQSRSA
jgi:hypothetical protein